MGWQARGRGRGGPWPALPTSAAAALPPSLPASIPSIPIPPCIHPLPSPPHSPRVLHTHRAAAAVVLAGGCARREGRGRHTSAPAAFAARLGVARLGLKHVARARPGAAQAAEGSREVRAVRSQEGRSPTPGAPVPNCQPQSPTATHHTQPPPTEVRVGLGAQEPGQHVGGAPAGHAPGIVVGGGASVVQRSVGGGGAAQQAAARLRAPRAAATASARGGARPAGTRRLLGSLLLHLDHPPTRLFLSIFQPAKHQAGTQARARTK